MINNKAVAVACFCLCTSIFPIQSFSQSAAHGVMLDTPYREIISLSESANGNVPIFFHNGFLIQVKHKSATTSDINVRLYDSNGVLEYQDSLLPAGAISCFISSADVSPSGHLVFSGYKTGLDGTMSSFLASSDLDGRNAHFIDMGAFSITQLSVSPDDSVWGVGAEKAQIREGLRRWSNYNMLRHFGKDGVLLNTLLPRWGTASYVTQEVDSSGGKPYNAYDKNNTLIASYGDPYWGPQPGYTNAQGSTEPIWLKTYLDGVVLYEGRSGVLYRYANSSSSLVSSGIDISYTPRAEINGLAVSDDGNVYASFRSRVGYGSQTSGVFILSSENEEGLMKWRPVREVNVNVGIGGGKLRVLGSDTNALVYRATQNKISWSNFLSRDTGITN